MYVIPHHRNASLQHYLKLLPVNKYSEHVNQAVPNLQQKNASLSILGKSACIEIVDSISDRWIHIKQATALSIKNPILGVGANQYGFYSCQGPGAFPHNIFLQILAELGIFIFGIFICIIYLSIKIIFNLIRKLKNKFELSIGIWLFSYFTSQISFALISGDYFVSAPIYFMVGFAASIINFEFNEKNK